MQDWNPPAWIVQDWILRLDCSPAADRPQASTSISQACLTPEDWSLLIDLDSMEHSDLDYPSDPPRTIIWDETSRLMGDLQQRLKGRLHISSPNGACDGPQNPGILSHGQHPTGALDRWMHIRSSHSVLEATFWKRKQNKKKGSRRLKLGGGETPVSSAHHRW